LFPSTDTEPLVSRTQNTPLTIESLEGLSKSQQESNAGAGDSISTIEVFRLKHQPPPVPVCLEIILSYFKQTPEEQVSALDEWMAAVSAEAAADEVWDMIAAAADAAGVDGPAQHH
jgi:hypothetical protein